MTFGERLLEYRNHVNLSQEKLAEKIGVTRQTVSKWETNQSVPDFDKILPLCEALGITTEELITGEKEVKNIELEEIKQENEKLEKEYMQKRSKKKAIVLSISIFLYCIATFSLPYMLEVLKYEEAHAVMIWAILCTIATVMIVYFFVAYPANENKKSIKEKLEEVNDTIEEINKLDDKNIKVGTVDEKIKTEALVIEIIATFFLVVYLLISFLTMAWHITWILWIVFALVELIVKLIFSMKKEKGSDKIEK